MPRNPFSVAFIPVSPLFAPTATFHRAVAEAFLNNFKPTPTGEEDLGASFVVYKDGKEIISLTGGWADAEKTKPYTEDTIQIIHSAGKTVMAIKWVSFRAGGCPLFNVDGWAHLVRAHSIAHMVSQGLLDYDKPISHYWPEFAQGGKENVLVKVGGIRSPSRGLIRR